MSTLAELGEAELLQRLALFAPPGQLDDDTACLAPDPRSLIVNTDVLVDGIHFSDNTTSAEDAGWRAVAANLSDLAASGVTSVDGITVGLVAPGDTRWDWVEGVYCGISSALKQFGGVLLGGDCSAGTNRLLAITALGRLGPLQLLRSGAEPGDVVVTSGAHGLSRLGLALLRQEVDPASAALNQALQERAIQQHRRPVPRFDALNSLLRCKPANLPWRAGGTDSSDGLIAAVQGLCRASGCGAVLQHSAIPRPNGWPQGERWDHWCLSGGEDFELVLTLPPAWAKAWQIAMPGSHCLGRMTEEADRMIWSDGSTVSGSSGFDHFQTETSGQEKPSQQGGL